MKLETKNDINYSASYVTLKKFEKLEGCDNIQHTIIFGNCVIVGKDVKEGDTGVFFPLECQISSEFLKQNNLFRHNDNNLDITKKGFFEDTGRVRCVRLRGFKSEGFFVPISFFNYLKCDFSQVAENTNFDTIDGVEICKKYRIKRVQSNNSNSKKTKKGLEKVSRVIDTYWNFHKDTEQLYRNLSRIKETDLIQISYKKHGTSMCSGYLPVKRKLSFIEKLLKVVGVKIDDIEYDYIYSSRKVIKNEFYNETKLTHYYEDDIWGLANKTIVPVLQKNMMIYSEIVGYLPSGQEIQKDYDYGCKEKEFNVYVYRITYTNPDGKVFEFSAKQVQDYCREFGLNAVQQLYYGTIKDLYVQLCYKYNTKVEEFDKDLFLSLLKLEYLEKDCDMCTKKVPAEGIVLRIEKNSIESYKLKSERFYNYETLLADKGETNIEDNQ